LRLLIGQLGFLLLLILGIFYLQLRALRHDRTGIQRRIPAGDFGIVADGKDAVIAVSHTGVLLKLIDPVGMAQDAGARHRHYELCVLAARADRRCRSARHRARSALRLIHMAVTSALYTLIAMKSAEEYRRNLQQMRAVIAKKRS